MTTRSAAEQSWKDYHKGIHPEVMPAMTGPFLYAFKRGIEYHKELVTGQMRQMIKNYEDGDDE